MSRVDTTENIADIFTKQLSEQKLFYLMKKPYLLNVSSNEHGSIQKHSSKCKEVSDGTDFGMRQICPCLLKGVIFAETVAKAQAKKTVEHDDDDFIFWTIFGSTLICGMLVGFILARWMWKKPNDVLMRTVGTQREIVKTESRSYPCFVCGELGH